MPNQGYLEAIFNILVAGGTFPSMLKGKLAR